MGSSGVVDLASKRQKKMDDEMITAFRGKCPECGGEKWHLWCDKGHGFEFVYGIECADCGTEGDLDRLQASFDEGENEFILMEEDDEAENQEV